MAFSGVIVLAVMDISTVIAELDGYYLFMDSVLEITINFYAHVNM